MAAPTTLGEQIAAGPEDPCALSEDFRADYSLRIGALFAVLFTSLIGAGIPLLTRTKSLDTIFFFGTVFATGVVLATGFVHILPDAEDALTNPCLQFSSEYPWTYAFAGGAALLTFVLEYFLKQYIRVRHGLPADSSVGQMHTHNIDVDVEVAEPEFKTGEEAKQQLLAAQVAENRVTALMLESGVVFHSIFIGIDLGINSDPSVVRPLMIALMFHQGFEGLALGTTFIRADFSNLKYTIYLIIFVLVTPVGVAIGLGVGASYNANGKIALGFEGAFNSVSAGILVYNGLVDLLLPTFTDAKLLRGNRLFQILAMAFLFGGYCAMALIAKWV